MSSKSNLLQPIELVVTRRYHNSEGIFQVGLWTKATCWKAKPIERFTPKRDQNKHQRKLKQKINLGKY